MNDKLQQAFFSSLADCFRQIGLDPSLTPGAGAPQLGDTLSTLLAVTEDAHPVFMELMVVHLKGDTFLLQFYTTILTELSPEKCDALTRGLCNLNFYCPVGHFGIFEDLHQLYHKYTLILDSMSDSIALNAAAMTGLEIIYDVLSHHYPLLISLSHGADSQE